ncbi:DUF2510 domain-containing protein [Mycobacterium kyorinense]|uniref:DUF2510 domain-containing protein n=1 Tax=Mycobacterium kyorinense TaxID=487514 RepID=A0A1X1XBA9_9MYCO|nr:DUF2510 domain-containing protein [Mycobacterium kyorinense]ORV96216.1 hypothetical protein AWC14_16840 [Mycobacterium kyorinense]
MTHPTPPPGWYPDPSGSGQRYFDGRQWTDLPPPPPAQPSVVINNNVGASAPAVVVTNGPNHGLHLALTLLTCGMWLPIWLIVAIVGHRRVQVGGGSGGSHTAMVVGAVVGVLFLLGLAASHFAAFVGLAVLGGLGFLGYWAYQRGVDRRAEQARIAARADAEHQAWMRGNPAGTYGLYPPVPPPDNPQQ